MEKILKQFGSLGNKEGSKETEEIKDLERRIRGLRPFLETLGKSRINLEFSERVGTLAFDHRTGSVKISLEFLREQGLNPDQIDFCLAHEIGHLIQLSRDPEGYLATFDFVEREAEKKAKSPEEQEILKTVYHSLFNVLFDINDNQIIQDEIVPYHPKEGSKAYIPPNLYKEKLFPPQKEREIPDYRQEPFYVQFLSYLLRKIMTGEESEISPEVKKRIEDRISAFGEKYTPEEFTRRYIQPSSVKSGEILLLAQRFLLPIFEELLEEDRKEKRLRVVKIIKIIDGEDPIETDKTRKGIAEKIKEDREKEKESSEEREEKFAKERFKEYLEEKGFSEEEIEELERIRQACQKEVINLTQLWHSFTRIVSAIELERERRHKTGVKINIHDLILQWTKLLEKPQEVEAMEKYVPVEKEYLLPKEIKIGLVLDLSGSMDKRKRKEVKKITYTIGTSLKRFQEEVNYQAGEMTIKTDCFPIGFGTKSRQLPFSKTADPERDFFQAILDISKNMEGTEDDKALRLAFDKFDPADYQRIKKGELLGIILEITDGETQTPQTSRKIIEKIDRQRIYCRGVQIPGDILAEISKKEREKRIKKGKPPWEILPSSGTFKEVWQEKGLRIDNIEQLKEILFRLLREAMEESK